MKFKKLSAYAGLIKIINKKTRLSSDNGELINNHESLFVNRISAERHDKVWLGAINPEHSEVNIGVKQKW